MAVTDLTANEQRLLRETDAMGHLHATYVARYFATAMRDLSERTPPLMERATVNEGRTEICLLTPDGVRASRELTS